MSWQCDDCGFRINGGCYPDDRKHECHPDGIVRVQASRLEAEFTAFLDSAAGRFEVHYAKRRLGRRP
jgi:hypothetical protein